MTSNKFSPQRTSLKAVAVLLLIAVALLIGNTTPSGANFKPSAKLALTNTPASRQHLLAVNRDVLAHNVQAYDLWVTPSEFWGASLLTPQNTEPSQEPIDQTEPQLNEEARLRRLLGALRPWPHHQAIVEYRLNDWPKSKNSPVLLAWALSPEVAKALSILAMPGILLKPRPAPPNPKDSIYAHAVGFMGLPDNAWGQDGLGMVTT